MQQFLTELGPQSLEYFEILSYSNLGPRSIEALGLHVNKLAELKLTSLDIDCISQLASLPTLPSLSVLVLTDSIPTLRDNAFYAVVERLALWMRSCKALRRLELRRFVDDPALLAQVLDHGHTQLDTLSLAGYHMGSEQVQLFHKSLSHQKSLKCLYLSGMGIAHSAANKLLCEAVCELDLRELELKDISDFFTPRNVGDVLRSQFGLERLWISGERFPDGYIKALELMRNLKSLVIQAPCDFTGDEILDFIDRLIRDGGHEGFSLSILNSVETITDWEESMIRDLIRGQLDGSFDFEVNLEIMEQEQYAMFLAAEGTSLDNRNDFGADIKLTRWTSRGGGRVVSGGGVGRRCLTLTCMLLFGAGEDIRMFLGRGRI